MRHAVYRVFDQCQSLIYVGCSINPTRRLADHSNTSTWFSQVHRIELEWFPTKEEALAVEAKAIREEMPAFNKAGTPLEDEAEYTSLEERKRVRAKLRQQRKRAKDRSQTRDKDRRRRVPVPPKSRLKTDLLISLAVQHGVHTRTIRRWLAQGKIELQATA